MDLTTVERVYAFDEALPSQKDKRTLIGMIITGISSEVEAFLGRNIQKDTYTEYFDVPEFSVPFVVLKGYPVLKDAEITPGVPNPLAFYTREDQLSTTEVDINYDTGRVVPKIPIYSGLGTFKVEYYGGMADDTEDFRTKYPDLEYEILLQIIFEYKRKRNMAMVSVGAGGNSAETYAPSELQPRLLKALRRYRLQCYV